MKEIRDIVGAYQLCRRSGKSAVLATVVHLEGSSYRRPGARMLIDEEGNMTGAISGGCLEGDALRKAMLTLTQKQNRLITYDTSDEEGGLIGLQLGCEGIIHVLFEYIDPESLLHPVCFLEHALANRQTGALITLFEPSNRNSNRSGTCLYLSSAGLVTGDMEQGPLRLAIISEAEQAIEKGASRFSIFESGTTAVHAFIQFFNPPVNLVIIGAGNDAIPLASIADLLGWDTVIVDGRRNYAKADRFSGACQVLVGTPENVLEHITIDRNTAFVLMTHNFQYDMGMLKSLLSFDLPYIGILGPKKKFNKMLEELLAQEIEMTKDQEDRIYAPTGLDLAAETPEEIALSIIAEIQKVINGGNAQPLKSREQAIHDRKSLEFVSLQLNQF